MSLPLPPLLVSITFLFAAFAKYRREQYEHVFTRLIVALWYGYVAMGAVDLSTQQVLGRFMFWLLGLVEVLSFLLRAWFGRQYKNAVGDINAKL